MGEQYSRTLKLKNALVTLHGWSNGTSILHVCETQGHGRSAGVWVNHDEIEELIEVLQSYRAQVVK